MASGLEGSVRRRERRFRTAAGRGYFRALLAGQMLWKELAFRSPVSPARRAWFLYRGFTTPNAVRYGLDGGNVDHFLPDSCWSRMMHLNGGFGPLLDNKYLFHQALHEFREFVPETTAMILKGRLYPLCGEERGAEAAAWPFLERAAPVVLKPVQGATARGVMFLSARDGRQYLNDREISAADLLGLVGRLDEYLVCEHVRQHPALERMYPHSTNTLKVLTVREVESRRPFIAAACLRVGTEASRPFEHPSRGGLTARVELDDGTIGRARGTYTPLESAHRTHPDTGSPIAGVVLPHWDLIGSVVLRICEALPFLNHLVWDLVVTESGFKILEGNNHPSLGLLQMHYPLLKDPRLRAFYARHGVVKR